MTHLKKKVLIGIGILLLLVLMGGGWYLSMAVPIGTGYAARYICSSVFTSHRNPQITYREDVAPINPLSKIIDVNIDHAQKKWWQVASACSNQQLCTGKVADARS
jgi:hypothetical protein